ncbi:DoxX family protein [Flavobacterium sp. J372]|uniref:DoxX family protein n=1 Tax=Flavobacterium sp. J372 TaxID=2898436 RepID=UPI002151D3A3|nr:DoxX family protein [Flavobacterium sp. J372]MCR5861580.1 DoxX family protein [Flavobacterium sp. J372]
MKKVFRFITGSVSSNANSYEIIYLLFRLHLGLSIALGAGLPKMFHKINENGPDDWSNKAFGASEWFINQVNDIGFTFISPSFWAYLAIYGEFIGGILIAIGLFTRLSAMQLAFQFFIISFLWYESPEPIVGMYFQQLFFFGYLLITAYGSGKYSLDKLLFQSKKAAI